MIGTYEDEKGFYVINAIVKVNSYGDRQVEVWLPYRKEMIVCKKETLDVCYNSLLNKLKCSHKLKEKDLVAAREKWGV